MNQIENLISLLSKLPGYGKRSARRSVLKMITAKQQLMQPLINSLNEVLESTKICETCGNIDVASPCSICTDSKRDSSKLCVIEEVADLWALERNRIFDGNYHVLGGTLSAIDGIGPEELNIAQLLSRIKSNDIKEVILALNATMNGQTTTHYIYNLLKELNIKVTMVAHGIPLGGEIDFLDEGTLNTALRARVEIK